MKRIFIILLIFIFTVFALPIIFTNTNIVNGKSAEKVNQENIIKNEEQQVNKIDYNYKQYDKIRLLHTKTNEVEELPLDEYLLGVVSSEMPADFHEEALNAQAVVARTYTIYSISNSGGKHGDVADICDESNCCQAWISKEDRLAKWDENVRDSNWKKIEMAVYNTAGKIITYDGKVIDAFFHSNSGGATEAPVNVWGGTDYPYLQSVQTSGEDAYSQYSSEVILTKEELKDKIIKKHSDFTIDYSQSDCIKILEYTESGRVRTVKIGNLNLSGVEVRTLLGLKSANFSVQIEGDNVKFSVKGYGHGVGMSQTGADSMAKAGSNYIDIIKHFYTGVEVVDM